eukprot:scaffold18264_cov67-Phaeocystis_antarctica.AAC.5
MTFTLGIHWIRLGGAGRPGEQPAGARAGARRRDGSVELEEQLVGELGQGARRDGRGARAVL